MEPRCYDCDRVFGLGDGQVSFRKLIGGKPICETCYQRPTRGSLGIAGRGSYDDPGFSDVVKAYEEDR